MDTTTPPPTTKPSYPAFDQIVKGNVSIKKLSKYRYRITFSKIGKFLVYQVWDKDNVSKQNDKRIVHYVSAKNWIKIFKEENDEPLFTPTTIMEMVDDRKFAFVLDKAYVNSSSQVVFTVSTKEIKVENNNISSKKLIKIPCGKFNNVRFDIDAPQNGWGIVFNKSDCGFPNVRMYGFGGDGPGVACGDQALAQCQRQKVWSDGGYNWTREELTC